MAGWALLGQKSISPPREGWLLFFSRLWPLFGSFFEGKELPSSFLFCDDSYLARIPEVSLPLVWGIALGREEGPFFPLTAEPS